MMVETAVQVKAGLVWTFLIEKYVDAPLLTHITLILPKMYPYLHAMKASIRSHFSRSDGALTMVKGVNKSVVIGLKEYAKQS